MATSKNIILVFLLVCTLFSNAFAQTKSPWHETWQITEHKAETSTNNTNMEIDSVDFYNNLIAQESAESNYGANVAGAFIGGGLTITGLICFIGAATTDVKTDKSKSSAEQIGEAVAVGAAGAFLMLTGVTFTLIGLPLFIYNINKYSKHKGHAENRDAYQRSLDRYLENKHSMRLMVAPAVNLLSAGGGINAVLQF